MKLIIDTNVFISGIFFRGPPFEIINAWRHSRVSLVISADILYEYQRIGEKLADDFPGVELNGWIHLLMLKAKLADAPPLKETVCNDPDDDKFFACAIATNTKLISSGDKHLLAVSGYQGITVLKPRTFVDNYLMKP